MMPDLEMSLDVNPSVQQVDKSSRLLHMVQGDRVPTGLLDIGEGCRLVLGIC
jgi:hypothetical protein